MGFFDNTEEVSGNTFELVGGGFEPIPNNTNLLAVADAAEWSVYEDEKTIQIKWIVLAPMAYAKRCIFQKIKLYDKDKAKAKRALTMLKIIDLNCGGKLAELSGAPTDTDLMKALMGKQLVIKVQVWEIKDDAGNVTKDGNWVCAVSPKAPVPEVAKQEPKKDPFAESQADFSPVKMNDDIPF